MNVLLSGHNGYIGSVAVQLLTTAGHEVTGLDIEYFAECTLPKVQELKIASVRKDIRDLTVNDLAGFEAVIHLAALSNDPLGELVPRLTHEINCQATVKIAKFAKQAGVRRFIFSSSCSVYGASEIEKPIDEKTKPNPISAYALSKVQAEHEIARLADDKFSPVFLRNATAYGVSPRLRVDVVLNNLVGWALTTGVVRIMSDGMAWRPLVHISDIARAMVAVLEADREIIHNQIFNVGRNTENYRVRELASIVSETIRGVRVEYAAGSSPDARSYRVDFTKIASLLPQWQPRWDARKGVQELYRAYQVAQLTEAEFTGHRYIRLKHLQQLLINKQLDESLRWLVNERKTVHASL